MSSLYKYTVMNRLANRVQTSSAKGSFSGSVTKNIEFKNESGIVLYDSDDEDNIKLSAPNECDNYTLQLPEEVGNEGDVLKIDDINTDDPDRPVVSLQFGMAFNQNLNTDNNVAFSEVNAPQLLTDSLSMGDHVSIVKDGDVRVSTKRGYNRFLTITDALNPTNTGRYSTVDVSALRVSTGTIGETITLDAGLICQNGYVYVKHSGCTIQLPALSLSIDTGYNALISSGAGAPAINNHYTVTICGDGANTFVLGNGNSPSGYTFINRSLPYTSASVFSVVKITFIRTSNAPNYDVIIQAM